MRKTIEINKSASTLEEICKIAEHYGQEEKIVYNFLLDVGLAAVREMGNLCCAGQVGKICHDWAKDRV